MEYINLDQIIPLEIQGHSSKGNQLKWKHDGYWYKADHMGYEGLSEVIISRLLRNSNMMDYVEYEPAQMEYKGKIFNGCRSKDFMKSGEELITIDRLFRQFTGKNLTFELAHFTSVKERIAYFIALIQEFTKLKDFGKYIATILEMDAFFLNEDRHTNNIAVIYNPNTRTYRNSPHFDNGLALFSDTNSDFLLDRSIQDCFHLIQAKPFSLSFEEQADEAVMLYGRQLKFHFQMKDVQNEIVKFKEIYDDRILERVKLIFREQMRKYQYMFE
jgi:hypothetical protein